MSEIIDIESAIRVLIPGFITAWIFYSLTEFNKPSQFERTVNALVLSFIISGITALIKYALLLVGDKIGVVVGAWTDNSDLASNALIAVILGVGFCYGANNDKIYAFIRKCRLTSKSGYPSQWLNAAQENLTSTDQWIVLELCDGNMVMGWPELWPSSLEVGEFHIVYPYKKDKDDFVRLKDVESMIVKAQEIKRISILKRGVVR